MASDFFDPQNEQAVRKAKKVNLIALALLFVLLIASFYAFLELEKSKRALEDSKQKLEQRQKELRDSTETLKYLRRDLENVTRSLEQSKEQAQNALRKLSANVQAGKFDEARRLVEDIEERAPSQEENRISVGFFTFNGDAGVRKSISNYLIRSGYRVVMDQSVAEIPAWMARNPTVLYYADQNEPVAIRIMEELRKLTGVQFLYKKGNPENVPKVEVDRRINIHYVVPPAKAPEMSKKNNW